MISIREAFSWLKKRRMGMPVVELNCLVVVKAITIIFFSICSFDSLVTNYKSLLATLSNVFYQKKKKKTLSNVFFNDFFIFFFLFLFLFLFSNQI